MPWRPLSRAKPNPSHSHPPGARRATAGAALVQGLTVHVPRGQFPWSSSRRKASLAPFGFALPPVSFITAPTKKPSSFFSPPR